MADRRSESNHRSRFAARRPAALDVLAIRNFRFFLASAAFADLGLSFRVVVTGWVVLELTDSAAWVGLVIGITALPTILLSLFGGVVADRVSKRQILITVRASHAALAFLAGLLISTGVVEAWHLVAIAIGIGLATAFGRPTGGSWVPNLVPRNRLVSANGLVGAANNTGEIIGPGLGGWLIGTAGTDTVFFVVAGVYAASFLTLGFVSDSGASTRVVRKAVFTEIKEGLKFAAGSQVILGVLIINTTGIFATALITMMPVYARDVLDVGVGGLGLMGAVLGAGFLVGSLIITLVGDVPRKVLVLWVGAVMWDFSVAGFAFSGYFPLSLALLFIVGAGGSIYFISAFSLIQGATPDDMRGRVMSIFGLTMDTVPLGALLGGFLAVTVNNWFPLILGAAISEPIMLICFMTRPEFRRA